MSGLRHTSAVLLALATSGCLSQPGYACADDLQCHGPSGEGTCTAEGWCAYPEPECRSGLRYSDLAAPEVAGACVAAEGETGSSTGEPMSATASSSEDTGCADGCSSSTSAVGEESSSGEPDCATTCIAGPHATAACDADDTCVITCEAPWEDCDGDPTTGCEVPVGMTAQCSQAGLDPEGCWTPYCGESTAANATNFGTYFCVSCETCREPGADQCSWCDQATGTWYPADAGCACGDWLGDVCSPA